MAIYKTAHFRVRSDSLETAKQAVREFVEYIKNYEPGTMIYTSVQNADDETSFVHFMGFVDTEAEEKHRTSDAVRRFTDILYPLTLDGVEFKDYTLCATT